MPIETVTLSDQADLARISRASSRIVPWLTREQSVELGALAAQYIEALFAHARFRRQFEGERIAVIFLLVQIADKWTPLLSDGFPVEKVNATTLLAAYAQYCVAVVRHAIANGEAGPDLGPQLARRALAFAHALEGRDPYLAEVRAKLARKAGEGKATARSYFEDAKELYGKQNWHSANQAAVKIAGALGDRYKELCIAAIKDNRKAPGKPPPKKTTVRTWIDSDFKSPRK